MLKKWVRRIHLILGLAAGLVVVVLGTTGSVLAFETELRDFTEPYRFSPATNAPLPPSDLMRAAEKAAPGMTPSAVNHYSPGRSATVEFYREKGGREEYWTEVFLDPATARVIHVADRKNEFNLFKFALEGHTHLWLPEKVGHEIVAYGTLAFTLLLVSGIVLWWPRNRPALKQRLAVKWKTGWKRRRHDLHAVLGFYGSLVALCIALTGLAWSFTWFSDMVYRIASGGEAPVEWTEALSDTSATDALATPLPYPAAMDSAWRIVRADPRVRSVNTRVPKNRASAITIYANPDETVFFRSDFLNFDRHTLREIPVRHVWGRYADADFAGRLQRMYYDIHIGAILGLPGKFIAFLAALIAASLPVTGFLMWFFRRKARRKKHSSSTSERISS
jgi:uncharacterized iron-regulated membrane protein